MLHRDIYRTIALEANIAVLKNLLQCDVVFGEILNDQIFWVDKFNHDNIPVILDNFVTGNDWVNEYQKVVQLKTKLAAVIDPIKDVADFTIFITGNVDFVVLHQLLAVNPSVCSGIKSQLNRAHPSDIFLTIMIEAVAKSYMVTVYNHIYVVGGGSIYQLSYQETLKLSVIANYLNLRISFLSGGKFTKVHCANISQ